ncbi:Geranylgeranyl diphosphate reductase (EC [Olavius sp. associated proteobacterium Delta 1]|nr:Geranylgeranyl diphosphate reductase (EC [Olavius sp. associated proteobacterium Delta 1]
MSPHDINSFDVIVIGAGPAGSTAAYLLALTGFKVLIIDKSTFPRDKLCGGLLTLKSIKLLEGIFSTSVDYLKARRVITYQSFSYKVGNSTGASVKGRLDNPFHFVNRKTYDHYWLKKAQGAGVEFKAGEKVVCLELSRKQVTTQSGRQFVGNFIFGADGALSWTRRFLSAKGVIKPDRKSELATTLEVLIPNRQVTGLQDYPTIYFGHTPWGYAWSFPGDQHQILGIAGLNRQAGRFINDDFTTFLKSLHISRQDIPRPKSHALPYGNYLTRPGYNNVLLLGDASGLADPLLGEGIYYAHKSAYLAAKAVMNSYSEPQDALTKYRRYLMRDIIAELKYIRLARQIIFSLPGNWTYKLLSSLLKTIPRLCEETIQGQRSYRWFRPINIENNKRNGT